ncbi:hypothetical protein BpHYR1_027868 [Brachionus plicatilis]|uniref:Uncharacterized protein n=1 Tax=Brachionus plicatilis TaxID=10195 RepID=A0A3M7SAF7_BRAPC|nr:hypothetical protein BpHYR1_027868 [Brachionus plicatilis]
MMSTKDNDGIYRKKVDFFIIIDLWHSILAFFVSYLDILTKTPIIYLIAILNRLVQKSKLYNQVLIFSIFINKSRLFIDKNSKEKPLIKLILEHDQKIYILNFNLKKF